MIRIILIALCLSPLFSKGQLSDRRNLKNGDILFQSSQSSQSRAIQLATRSVYSHVAIYIVIDKKPFVFEAVQPVKLTPFASWVNKGEDDVFWAKRLHNRVDGLSKQEQVKMRELFLKHLGKDYDIYFSWNDTEMYCSELVWKIYKDLLDIEVGQFQTLKDLDLSNAQVKAKLKERYGDNIPMNEKMITPEAIFQSPLLIPIAP